MDQIGAMTGYFPAIATSSDGHNSSSSEAATSPGYSESSGNTTDSGITSDIANISCAPTPIHNLQPPPQFDLQQYAALQQHSQMMYQYAQMQQQQSFSSLPQFQMPQVPMINDYPKLQVPKEEPTVEQKRPIPSPLPKKYVAEPITDEELSARLKITLGCEETWKLFENSQTEMIITKTGRNLFPKLTFKVKGLEPANCYLIFLKFRRVTDQKYKYTKGEWQSAGKADDIGDVEQCYPASENISYPTGKDWMQNEVSFSKLKLTNNPENVSNKNAVVLRSMHKYRPVLKIMRFNPAEKTFSDYLEKEIARAEFIAVTAYQNNEVTKLKIQNNPFAKGFREGGRKRSGASIESGTPAKQHDPGNPMPFMMNQLLGPMSYMNYQLPNYYFPNTPSNMPTFFPNH